MTAPLQALASSTDGASKLCTTASKSGGSSGRMTRERVIREQRVLVLGDEQDDLGVVSRTEDAGRTSRPQFSSVVFVELRSERRLPRSSGDLRSTTTGLSHKMHFAP